MTDVVGLDGFDWDEGNTAKCQKHGVTQAEIEAAFLSEPATSEDSAHSIGEARYFAVGRNALGRAILIVYTWRTRDGRRLVRPISARYIGRRRGAP
jgi:uncharacterized DUF497 family protein